jgi:hypothetical protein
MMMFCEQCGQKMPEGAVFCPSCGGRTSGGPLERTAADSPAQASGRGLCCPNCRSADLSATVETSVSGGYSGLDGFCGLICFGPVGLLCGACGRGVSSKNRYFWVCRSCGHKFRNAEDQLREWQEQFSGCFGLGAAAFLLAVWLWNQPASEGWGDFALFAFVAAAGLAGAGVKRLLDYNKLKERINSHAGSNPK